MLSLLRSEWYQVRRALSIKIVFGVTLIGSLIFGFQIMNQEYLMTLKELDKQYLFYGGGSLCGSMEDGAACLLFASLFAGWIIGTAFENRTIQGAISYGKSRTKVFLAKMLMFLTVCIGICLIYWFAGSLPAFVKNGMGTEEVAGNLCHIEYIIGMLLSGILAYVSLFSVCGLIGFWNRKTGATMGICFVAILFGGNLLAAVLPESIISVLNNTPLGLYKQVMRTDVCWADIWKTSCISLIWTIVLGSIGIWKFKRTELK